MTDEQFDELARSALAFEINMPSESTWIRIAPRRWTWLPTIQEVLGCACVCALALAFVGLKRTNKNELQAKTNPIIEGALHDETRSVVASVTWVAGSTVGSFQPRSRVQ